MRNKKYFFGWTNIKRGITELIKIYSHKPSSLSKKRIESGVAFIIAQWGMVFYLLKQYPNLDMIDIIMWASVEFGISGYIIHQIQKEKIVDNIPDDTDQEPN
jgi:hypothetical protein